MNWLMNKVIFYSDGLKLDANLYIPKDYKQGEKRPGVVCCHGYSGMKDVYLLPVPERLTENGYISLTFDHRGFGKSEGVRARNILMEQVRDIRNSMTFLQQQPQVDPERIGLYGTSFGGSNVAYTAAVDERAKCIVAVAAATGNGRCLLKSLRRYGEWLSFLKVLEEDRVRRVLTGESKRVDFEDIFPFDPHSSAVLKEEINPAKLYPEGFPLENADSILEYCPEEVVHKISPRPICFIHSGNDAVAPVEGIVRMYEKAGDPKKMVIIPNARHYDVYKFVNPEVYEKVMRETIDWYKKYL